MVNFRFGQISISFIFGLNPMLPLFLSECIFLSKNKPYRSILRSPQFIPIGPNFEIFMEVFRWSEFQS